MQNSKTIGLDTDKLYREMLNNVVTEQTRRFIEYAKKEVAKIGDHIKTYASGNHMDRTGNLLNSLCWGVSYDGKLVGGGFYRKAIARNKGIDGTSTSYLHEWFSGDEKYLLPVNGRKLAYDYVIKYGNNGSRGWRVFFAILAPYWGYWEKGFKLKSYFGEGGARFMQFAVMTHFFDEVKTELRPARTRFRCSVPKYTHEQLVKKWNKQTKF